MKVAKHAVDLVNDEVRPIYSTLYWAQLAARQFAAEKINSVIAGNNIEPTTIEEEAVI